MKRRNFLNLAVKSGLAALVGGVSLFDTGCGKKTSTHPPVDNTPRISKERLFAMYDMEPAELVRTFNSVVDEFKLPVSHFKDECDLVSIVQVLHFEQLYYNHSDMKKNDVKLADQEFYVGAQAIVDVMMNRMNFTKGTWPMPTDFIDSGQGIVHDKFGYNWAQLIWWNTKKGPVKGNIKRYEWSCLKDYYKFFVADRSMFHSFTSDYVAKNGDYLDSHVISVVKRALIDTALGINLDEKHNGNKYELHVVKYAHPTRFALFYRNEDVKSCIDGWEGNTAFGSYRLYATGYTAVTPNGSGKHTFYGIGLPVDIIGLKEHEKQRLAVIAIDHRDHDNKNYPAANPIPELIVPTPYLGRTQISRVSAK